jgi:hypothetical protein
MFVPRLSEDGPDRGKWYMMAIEGQAAPRRAGYCARRCTGHSTREEAAEHHLQYQLDREVDLWLDRRNLSRECEICGEMTTLRARLGRKSDLFVLCGRHQSTSSLQTVFRRRAGCAPERQL